MKAQDIFALAAIGFLMAALTYAITITLGK